MHLTCSFTDLDNERRSKDKIKADFELGMARCSNLNTIFDNFRETVVESTAPRKIEAMTRLLDILGEWKTEVHVVISLHVQGIKNKNFRKHATIKFQNIEKKYIDKLLEITNFINRE